jgi:glycosyltransferase involved in cell wall biosynthesis
MSLTKDHHLRVFLSAYACEPGKGSEPGVGWKWTCGLAGRVDLTVLTRSNNRKPIEAAIAALPEDHPMRSVRFLYHDNGPAWRWLKRRRLLPTLPYYFLWQWTAARKFRDVAESMDIIHHLTFCTALCPGFWMPRRASFVVGPVAAPMVDRRYLPLFGIRALTQALRNGLIRNFLHLPWLRKSFAQAAAIVPANSDMKTLLQGMGIESEDVMLDTGAPEISSSITNIQEPTSSGTAACTFLYAGVLERRKGLELALRAFSILIQNSKFKIQNFPSLTLLGDGPDRERLQKLARTLGIAGHVHFPGRVPHDEMARHFRQSDVFLFTSVRDASGGVNLEAMSHGLPVICIAHQGVADITTDACALRVPPGPIPETIDKLAAAMTRLASDPTLRHQLGTEAKRRATEDFSWNAKFARMLAIYGRARPPGAPTPPSSAGG